MQISQEGGVAQPQGTEHVYIVIDLEYNNIRDEGCLWLVKADFPQLEKLNLCKSSSTQAATTSMTRDRNISCLATGLNSSNYC